jgi:hypothetical protein
MNVTEVTYFIVLILVGIRNMNRIQAQLINSPHPAPP